MKDQVFLIKWLASVYVSHFKFILRQNFKFWLARLRNDPPVANKSGMKLITG